MDLPQARKNIERALAAGKLAVCVGNCTIKYAGRAASKISDGDRLLVIKHDGTFLVHQSTGMKAINYQGPGSVVSVTEENGELVVKSERTKPMHELIEVHSASALISAIRSKCTTTPNSNCSEAKRSWRESSCKTCT